MKASEATYCIVDTETTGLDPNAGDRVVEVGLLRFRLGDDPWTSTSFFSALVDPQRSIPIGASAVHGISDEDVAGARKIDELFPELQQFAIGDVPVAHNAKFDSGFLPGLSAREWLCTVRFAHHVAPDLPDFKNQTLKWYFGRKFKGADEHRALGDCRVTAFNLSHLIRLYLEQGGADDVDALVAFSASLFEYRTINFRPYRGQSFSAPDIGWLRWAWSKPGADDPDLRYTIEREVARRKAVAA